MIVGLTGGIASGKSTVTKILRELGAYVVDADVWARTVVSPGSDGLKKIVETFGGEVLHKDGSLNRPALGGIVFHDDEARHKLNAITHPRVRDGMKEETEQFFAEHPNEPIVWDVPLLFEGDTKNLVDTTVLVYVDADTQLRRLMERDGLSERDALARIRSQMSLDEKRQLARYVIDNRGGIDQTREQVEQIWHSLRREADRS